jgi:acyl dehydratase
MTVVTDEGRPPDVTGKVYPPHRYEVSADAIRRYAATVGERDPVHLDAGAARAAGHPDVVAPPMFAAVYVHGALQQAFDDPEAAIDLPRLLHVEQEFTWGEPVVAGDVLLTTLWVERDRTRAGQRVCVFPCVAVNERGAVVVRGRCTALVRGR